MKRNITYKKISPLDIARVLLRFLAIMNLRVKKVIIIFFRSNDNYYIIILLYLLIFQKPISINADSVTQVNIIFSEYSENFSDGTFYRLELTDPEKIDVFLGEINQIRARKTWDESEDIDDIYVDMIIKWGKGEIIIWGNGLISMNEGCDHYKMTNKKGNEFYQYIKNMCTSDENCQISFF